jgi:hypothetical protein
MTGALVGRRGRKRGIGCGGGAPVGHRSQSATRGRRRASLGTQSRAGTTFAAKMPSAHNTCQLDLGVAGTPGSGPLPITSPRMTHLWDGLCTVYRVLGFESVTKGDRVFRDLVFARNHRADQQGRRWAGFWAKCPPGRIREPIHSDGTRRLTTVSAKGGQAQCAVI